MIDVPSGSDPQELSSREAADLEIVRQAAKAGYEGRPGSVDVPEAVKERQHRRTERERKAYKNHYLGSAQKPS
jgi:hypothetical protein